MSKNYEDRRKKNIEDNKRILQELGLLNPFNPLPKVQRKKCIIRDHEEKKTEEKKPKKKVILTNEHTKPEDVEGYGSKFSTEGAKATRSSSRLRGKKINLSEVMLEEEAYNKEAEESSDDELDGGYSKKALKDRPMVYGPIPGIEVGTWWKMRMHCNYDGVHRPVVAGIHPGPSGAYSIALSGGYEDDIDMGDCFTYTGEGGRDLKGTASNPKNLRTAAQSKDQCLSRGNMALKTSSENGYPIRVIRGFKCPSPFAPEEGYRYDGLYKCEKAWFTTGMAGFGVWKFALRRIKDQAPPPWTIEGVAEEGTPEPGQGSSQDSGIESTSSSQKDVKDETSEDTEDLKQEDKGDTKGEKKAEKKEKKKKEKQEVKEEMGEEKSPKKKGKKERVEKTEKKDKIEEKEIKVEIKEETDKKENDETEEKPDQVKNEGNMTKDGEQDRPKKEELKPDEAQEEENNNETHQEEEEKKPMKEIKKNVDGGKKNPQKKRKAEVIDVDTEDDDDATSPKTKKPRETKKAKKEKENAAMSKGLMGWLVKTP